MTTSSTAFDQIAVKMHSIAGCKTFNFTLISVRSCPLGIKPERRLPLNFRLHLFEAIKLNMCNIKNLSFSRLFLGNRLGLSNQYEILCYNINLFRAYINVYTF